MVRSSSSSASSRKVCPTNKFSLFSGCISWDTSLACIFLCALLIICILLLSTKQLPRDTKEGDIIESRNNIMNYNSKYNSLPLNEKKPTIKKHSEGSSEKYSRDSGNKYNRVDDLFDANDTRRSPNEGTGTPVSEQIKYDINIHNVNIRDDNPEYPNRNRISSMQYEAEKNMERIINPLLPPERSYSNTYGIPINIPSRGPLQSYQQVGILYKENIVDTDKLPGNNSDSNILPLFGRPTFNGSKRWNYYTSSDKFQNFKIPITRNGRKCNDDMGCDEIMNGEMITIPSYNGQFKVEIYNYDRPSYIPFVY
jgi:hypothetical protein